LSFFQLIQALRSDAFPGSGSIAPALRSLALR
jgi:hypothetical protein